MQSLYVGNDRTLLLPEGGIRSGICTRHPRASKHYSQHRSPSGCHLKGSGKERTQPADILGVSTCNQYLAPAGRASGVDSALPFLPSHFPGITPCSAEAVHSAWKLSSFRHIGGGCGTLFLFVGWVGLPGRFAESTTAENDDLSTSFQQQPRVKARHNPAMATFYHAPSLSSESKDCVSCLGALQTQLRETADDAAQESVEDSLGRFRVWASNIGALQPKESTTSLDYRLRDAASMRAGVLSGLERLQLCTNKGKKLDLSRTRPGQRVLTSTL
jgi:hypothetical protein